MPGEDNTALECVCVCVCVCVCACVCVYVSAFWSVIMLPQFESVIKVTKS